MDNNNVLALYDFNSFKLQQKEEDYILKLNNSSNLKFFKDELTIKYVGKGFHTVDYASVQANKPITKNLAIFYYEIEILDEGSRCDITIGFSDKEFLINKQIGTTSKSFGYTGDGKILHNKTKGDPFSSKFKVKDIVGCGYYLSRNSIFYTLNGKFLGWAFKDIEFNYYFPTISLHSLNEKVTVNFGKKPFLFDLEGFYIKQMVEKINVINQEVVNIGDLDYMVREYLVHSGYQESLNALESEANLICKNNHSDVKMTIPRKDSNLIDELLELANSKDKTGMVVDEINLYEANKIIRKYSEDLQVPDIKNRSLSMMMDRINDEKNENSDNTKTNSDIFLIMNFLEERKKLQNMISDRKYDEALRYFESKFQVYSSKNEQNFKKIILCLVCLKLFDCLMNNDYMQGFSNLNKLDISFWNKNITISLYDAEEKIYDYCLEDLSVLLCYDGINNNNFKHFFMDKQTSLISNQINSLILEFAALSRESVLEKVIKQHMLTNFVYKTVKNSFGEKLSIKI